MNKMKNRVVQKAVSILTLMHRALRSHSQLYATTFPAATLHSETFVRVCPLLQPFCRWVRAGKC